MENVFDILRTFHIRKNVEEGMTQAEWIELLDMIEEMAEVPVTWIQDHSVFIKGGDE